MTDNRQIIIPGRHDSARLLFFRDGNRVRVEFDDGYGTEAGMLFDEHHLARLRTWLNTGISPSAIDLVDPVPSVLLDRCKATFDPKPRDLREPRP